MRTPLRDFPREVSVLVAVAFAVALGFGVVAPAIPLFAREFGVGRTAAAAVVSVFALTRLVAALGAGRLADRIGERSAIAAGIAVVAVSSALAGLAQGYWQLLVLRGAGGVGSALFTIAATALLLRAVPAEQRGQAQGLFQGGFLLGGIAGPAVGGLVTGVSLRAPFFLYAVTLGVAGALGLALLPRRELGGLPGAATAVTTLRTAARSPAYRAALTARFAHAWTLLGVRAALVPLYVADVLRREPLWAGVGFVLTAALSGLVLLPAGRFADTRGRKPVLVAGGIVSAVSMLVLALAETLPGYLVAMGLLGLGAGLLGPAPAAIVGDVVRGRGGTAVAAYQMAGDAGAVLGPLAAGRLADAASYGVAFGATAGVLGTATAVALLAPETRAPAQRDPARTPPDRAR